MSGFGDQPAGGSPYGLGTPSVQADLGGKALRVANSNKQTGSRYFDPQKKDYVIGDDGRIEGMDDVQQLVVLAVTTTLGSSSDSDLGQTLRSIDRITSNIEKRVESTLTQAVSRLVADGLIQVLGVRVTIVRPGVVHVRFQWRNLLSGLDNETFVPLTR